MEYTPQQKAALSAIEVFLNSEESIFILNGYAGTGKTTIIRPIIDSAWAFGRSCLLMAPTGRAAKILSEKTDVTATTIHKAIYKLAGVEAVEGDGNTESRLQYCFPLRQMCDSMRPGMPTSPDKALLIIDESSMISSRKNVGDLFVFGTGILLDDILSFARLREGGKIIFVGDPAQLEPVGDPDSYALNESYLQSKGFSVSSFELTDVVRQDTESTILSNSIKLRTCINSEIRTDLILDRKTGEVEDIEVDDIASRYCETSPTPGFDAPVVICWSNRQAAGYNNEIRRIYHGDNFDNVHIGDRLIIVGNNYSADTQEVLNGEFALVEEFSDEIETQKGIVYVDDGEGEKKRLVIDLSFRDMTLMFEDGRIVKCKVFDSLLGSTQPNITYQEQCALMSNFNMRHTGIKPGSPEYLLALRSDPYYNAIRAKYGYSVTCHKAQGGEWETVFADFTGRGGLSRDCLRWSYTALTRARRVLYGCSLHRIPQLKAKVIDIVAVSNVPAEYYPLEAGVPIGPFHSESDSAPMRAKFWQVVGTIEGTGFKVTGIDHQQYRESYILTDVEGNSFRLDAVYNRAGIFKSFVSVDKKVPAEIVELINNSEPFHIPFNYCPSNRNLEELYRKISSICDEYGISVVNVVEHLGNYKVSYYLQTDAAFAYLDICINKFGQITYISPRSQMSKDDEKLVKLVESIKS